MTVDFWLTGPAQFVLRCCVGMTCVWLLAAASALVLQRFSAALRLRIWSLSMLAALALPIAVLMMPELRVGWFELKPDPSAPTLAHRTASPVLNTVANEASPETVTRRLSNDGSDGSPHLTPQAPAPTLAGVSNSGESNPAGSVSRSAGNRWLGLLLIPLMWQLVHLGRSLLAMRNAIRQAQIITDLRAVRMLAAWRERLGSPGRIQLRSSSATKVPLCTGIWQPTIILPEQWQEWPESTLSAAIGHELAHIARRDVVWQLLAAVVCALYWFHPLSYVAAWRMRVERESACDDVVLAAGQPPIEYARILLDLARQLSAEATSSLVLPMAAGKDFEQRVRAILAEGRARSPVQRTANIFLIAATLMIVGAIGTLSPLSSDISTPSLAAAEAVSEAPAAVQDKPFPAAIKEQSGERVEVLGEVVDENGKPVSRIEVTDIGDEPHSRATTRSDANGRFFFSIVRNRKSSVLLVARSADGQQQGFARRYPFGPKPLPAVERIVLGKARAIEFHVVDGEKRPVSEAVVVATSGHSKITDLKTNREGKAVLLVPEKLIVHYVYAVKLKAGLDYFPIRQAGWPVTDTQLLLADYDMPINLMLSGTRPVRLRYVDENSQPLAGVRVTPESLKLPNKSSINFNTTWERGVTDRDGYVDFHTIPTNIIAPIAFGSQKEKYFAPERIVFNPKGTSNEMTVQLLRQVPVRGSVKLGDGKPGARSSVMINGQGQRNDSFEREVTCNERGEFEVYVDTDKCYLFTAKLGQQASATVARLVLKGPETEAVELSLEPATRIFGTVRSPVDGKPLGGEWLRLFSRNGGNYLELLKDKKLPIKIDPLQGFSPRVSGVTISDEAGRFEFFAGRGEYYVSGSNVSKKAAVIELNGQQELELTLETDLPPAIELSGKTVLASDTAQAVAEVAINAVPFPKHATGDPGDNFGAVSDAAGTFAVKRSATEMLVTARSKDGLLGAIATLSAEAKDLVIPLVPTASARGRLLDSITGEPIAGQRIDYAFEQTYPGGATSFFYGNFSGTAISDARGNFTLKGILAGGNYKLQLIQIPNRPASTRVTVGEIRAAKADVIELGNVKVTQMQDVSQP